MTAVDVAPDEGAFSTVGPPAGGSGTPRDGWHRALVLGATAYVVSRVLVLAGAGLASARSATGGLTDVLTAWDGQWYLQVVRDGYPSRVPAGIDSVGRWDEARVGFFPLYPLLVDVADRCLPGHEVVAALMVNLVLGAAFVALVGLLAKAWFGVGAARRAMVLTAFLPGSFVLSFAYSEALLLVLAAASLLALHRRQWILAGMTAALATATRPNGLAVVAACGVAAIVAVQERREWRSLVAPALAPLGFVAFHLYLRLQTGESGVWFRVQRLVWEEHLTFGGSTAWEMRHFLTDPGRTVDQFLTTVTVLAAIALVAVARKVRVPRPAAAYVATVLVLMVLTSTVTARPRFLYTAFPLIIALAAWWPWSGRPLARRAWQVLVLASGVGLVAVTALYGAYDAVP
jgi:hypothetical protein